MISWYLVANSAPTGLTSGQTSAASISTRITGASQMWSSSAVRYSTSSSNGAVTESYSQTIKGTTNSTSQNGSSFSSTSLATVHITTSTTQEYATNERRTSTTNLGYALYTTATTATTATDEASFYFATTTSLREVAWTKNVLVTLTRDTTTTAGTAIAADQNFAGQVWQAATTGDKPELLWWVDSSAAIVTSPRVARTAAQSATRITMESPYITEAVLYTYPPPAFTSVTNPSSTYAIQYHTYSEQTTTRTVTTISREDPEDPESNDPPSFTLLLPPAITTSTFTYASFGLHETTLMAYSSDSMQYNHRSAQATRAHSKSTTLKDFSFGQDVTTTTIVVSTHTASVNNDNLNANYNLTEPGVSRSFAHIAATTTQSAVQYCVTFADSAPGAKVWGPFGIYKDSSVAAANYWTAGAAYELQDANLAIAGTFGQAPFVADAASVYIARVQRGAVSTIFPTTYALTNGTAQVSGSVVSVTLTDETGSTLETAEIGCAGESWVDVVYDHTNAQYGLWGKMRHPPFSQLGVGGPGNSPMVGFVNLDARHTGVETVPGGAYLAYGQNGSSVIETEGHISTFGGGESRGTSYLERIPIVSMDSVFFVQPNRARRVLTMLQNPVDSNITAF